MNRRLLIALVVLLSILPCHAAAPNVYALTGGTVHTVSSGAISGGTVIIRDGLIEAVGRNVTIPPDATVIDVTGMHVYPGMIDGLTSFGVAAPRSESSSGAGGGGGSRTDYSATGAHVLTTTLVKFDADAVETRRSAGITTIHVAPRGGIFNGQTAIYNLAGETPENMLLRRDAAQYVEFNTRDWNTYPSSLMGAISYIRQHLLDAQHARAAFAVYDRNPAGKQRPTVQREPDALRPVVAKQLPLIFSADSPAMITRAAAIAKEFDVRWIIAGARESFGAAEQIRTLGVPVLVSVDFPQAPKDESVRQEQSLKTIRNRVKSPTSPAELARRGVPFALVSSTAKTPADFMKGVRKAIANGLSEEDALRAVTLAPATILGVDRQVGSLDRGKIANVVVATGPLFAEDTKIRNVFVDGRNYPVREPKKDTASADSPLTGTWNVTVRLADGEASIQFTLAVEAEKVTGTFSSDRFGSGDVRDGSFKDNGFEIVIAAQVTGETNDWRFRGTIDGNTMTGTASSPIGTYDFNGRKSE